MLVTRNVVTKEEVIAAVKELAAKLGRPPRYAELIRVLNVTRRQVQRMFGGWASVLEESGCERLRLGGGELTMHQLWHDWVAVARKAGRIPTIRQYEKFSRYSVRPLKDRLAAWDRIPTAMLDYGSSKGLWAGWEDVKELIERRLQDCPRVQTFTRANGGFTAEARRRGENDGAYRGFARINADSAQIQPGSARNNASPVTANYTQQPRVLATPAPENIDESLLYGEPLSLAPMATAPTNEAGVMFLFATLARELGFVVLKVQKGFPDCEALRRLANGKWQRVRIEFEFASRNFVLHGHDGKSCDLIVCWEHNWGECPVEVLELRRIFTADQENLVIG
ncbi:MAG: homing endonuclease associated repeat-containing protein [Actinomycetota bacterium]